MNYYSIFTRSKIIVKRNLIKIELINFKQLNYSLRMKIITVKSLKPELVNKSVVITTDDDDGKISIDVYENEIQCWSTKYTETLVTFFSSDFRDLTIDNGTAREVREIVHNYPVPENTVYIRERSYKEFVKSTWMDNTIKKFSDVMMLCCFEIESREGIQFRMINGCKCSIVPIQPFTTELTKIKRLKPETVNYLSKCETFMIQYLN